MKRAALAVLILAASATAATAQTDETAELTLSGQGGVTFLAPQWKRARSEEAVAVLERAADVEARTPFAMLLMAVEQGPARTDEVDWARIRDNVVAAAKETGSTLELELGTDYVGAEGFSGKRLRGTLKAGERRVAVEMVALVAQDLLVTVSGVGPADGAEVGPLVERVAATTRRSPAE